MTLNYINVVDAEGQTLRIRVSDFKASGFVKFDASKYADEVRPKTEEDEKEIWIRVAKLVAEKFDEKQNRIKSFLEKEFNSKIVSIEFDEAMGEITVKENHVTIDKRKQGTNQKSRQQLAKSGTSHKTTAGSKNLSGKTGTKR